MQFSLIQAFERSLIEVLAHAVQVGIRRVARGEREVRQRQRRVKDSSGGVWWSGVVAVQ